MWKNNYSFVSTHAYFGSRSHPKSSIKFKLSRLFMGKCLNLVLYFFLGIKIKDTQCGFKLYNSKYIKKIFKEMNIYDFSGSSSIVFKSALRLLVLKSSTSSRIMNLGLLEIDVLNNFFFKSRILSILELIMSVPER